MNLPIKHGALCAALVLSLTALNAHAGLIVNAGKASTSNKTVKTTTSGQSTILMNVDPFNVASFNLDVSFEADKVQFMGVVGLNGYIVDDFNPVTEGSFGMIENIHGFFPGFQDRFLEEEGGVFGLPVNNPPPGEIDIFQLIFLDLRPDLDKTFGVFATDTDDYLRGFDPATGQFTRAQGPYNPLTDLGVLPAFYTVRGVPGPGGGGGPYDVPLPGALLMGVAGGAGVLANRFRRSRK